MKALVLAAGYGTRLYALGANTPKPLLDINGKPLINYTLDKIRRLKGLREVIVVTNNKFYSVFIAWAQQAQSGGGRGGAGSCCSEQSFPCPIRIVNDGTNTPEERLGSIGDIDFVLRQQPLEDDLLVVGGDNLFDYSLDSYLDFAASQSPSVTIGLYDIKDLEGAKKFGVVELDKGKRIVSFIEKPAQPKSSLIAMCFYYFPKETQPYFAQYLNGVEKSDTAGDYIRWLHEKKDVYGFEFHGKWFDIGSIESYKDAQANFR